MSAAVRGAVIPIAFFLYWEVASRFGLVTSETFSRPSNILVAGYFALLHGNLLLATAQTLQAALVGTCLAILIGVPLGVAIGLSSMARLTIAPTLDVLQPVPPVALIPLTLLLFGFGLFMEASVVAFASIWPILVATVAAVRSLEKRLAEVALVLELNPSTYVRKVVLPAALARIAVGIRIAMGIALVVAVTVEIVVNPRGLGHGMVVAQQSLRPDLVYAQLFWIGIVGWLLNAALLKFDRSFLARFSAAGVRR